MSKQFVRLLATLAVVSVTTFAQSAPTPAQITTAKKVFVANAGETPTFNFERGRAYSEFYKDLRAWGHYEFVGSPSEADLVLEIGLVGESEYYGDKIELVPVLKLRVIDPKTQIAVWTFNEELEKGKFVVVGSRLNAKFDKAMARIVNDLKALTKNSPTTTSTAKP